MNDENQYTTSPFHQINAEGKPVMLVGLEPKKFTIEREQTWNPYTVLQLAHSQYSHVPEEKLWQQNSVPMPINPKRIQYDHWMVTRPTEQDPVAQGPSMQLNPVINPSAFGVAPGVALTLWSKGRSLEGIIRKVAGHRQVQAPSCEPRASNKMRAYDLAWAAQTLLDYDSGNSEYRVIYTEAAKARELPDMGFGAGNDIVSSLNRNVFVRLLAQIHSPGIGDVMLAVSQYLQEQNMNDVMVRKEFFTLAAGKFQEQWGRIQAHANRDEFLIAWLLMAHPSSEVEAYPQYEWYMFCLAHFVVSNQWPLSTAYSRAAIGPYPKIAQPSVPTTAFQKTMGVFGMGAKTLGEYFKLGSKYPAAGLFLQWMGQRGLDFAEYKTPEAALQAAYSQMRVKFERTNGRPPNEEERQSIYTALYAESNYGAVNAEFATFAT